MDNCIRCKKKLDDSQNKTCDACMKCIGEVLVVKDVLNIIVALI